MPRWKQVYNEETGKSEFIPIDEAARKLGGQVAVHGDIEPFVSPVDGTVISDRKQLREHNKRNNVVNYHEFDGAEQQKRQAERERLHTGQHTAKESLARKRELWEVFNRAERNHRG